MIRRPPRSTLFPTRRSSDLPRRPTASSANRNTLLNLGRSGKPQETAARVTIASVASEYIDRKSTRLNSSHSQISYAVFCLKKKKNRIEIILRKESDTNEI